MLFVITIWVLCIRKGGPLNLLTWLKGGYLKNMGAISGGLEKIWNKKQFLLHSPLQLKLWLVPYNYLPFIFGKPSESLYWGERSTSKPSTTVTASINHVLNPKNKERIRIIDRKGQQIVLIENVLFKVTTACAASFVIPPKANRRKRHLTLRTMKTGTFLNLLKPYFLSVTDGGTFLISFRKLFVQS